MVENSLQTMYHGSGEKSGGRGCVENSNRLIDTDFEKSKVQKLRSELLARYITISYYLDLMSDDQMLAQGSENDLTQ